MLPFTFSQALIGLCNQPRHFHIQDSLPYICLTYLAARNMGEAFTQAREMLL